MLATDVDCDLLDRASGELKGRGVLLADGVGGLAADRESFSGKSKFAGLGADLALANHLLVDEEFEIAVRDELGILAVLRELNSKQHFARGNILGGDHLLLLDAKEVVNVVKLPVLDEKAMPAEAAALGEQNALGARLVDGDLGKDGGGLVADVGRNSFGNIRCVRKIIKGRAGFGKFRPLDGELLARGAIVEREDVVLQRLIRSRIMI